MIKPGVLCDLVPLWIRFSLAHLSCSGFEIKYSDQFSGMSCLFPKWFVFVIVYWLVAFLITDESSLCSNVSKVLTLNHSQRVFSKLIHAFVLSLSSQNIWLQIIFSIKFRSALLLNVWQLLFPTPSNPYPKIPSAFELRDQAAYSSESYVWALHIAYRRMLPHPPCIIL